MLRELGYLRYRGEGNPVLAHPSTAVGNYIPGIEVDFRNVWRRIFVGIELHEGSNVVAAVDPTADAELQILASGWRLISVMDTHVTAPVIGPPSRGGADAPLADSFGDSVAALEWSNALALLLYRNAGLFVGCRFQNLTNANDIREFNLLLREFFETRSVNGQMVKQAIISRDLLQPGELSQSLCAPWQSDYRECICIYWAASRPDFVNVEMGQNGTSIGHNWIQKNRTLSTPKRYIPDDLKNPKLVSHSDLYENWESSLRFVFAGKDENYDPNHQRSRRTNQNRRAKKAGTRGAKPKRS